MKWNKKSLEQYVQAKEYIDTLVIPLDPFHLSRDNDLEISAFQSEVLSVFLHEIEKELTGRIMLSPSYNYLKTSDKDIESERVNTWITDAKNQPFNHVFLVTFDTAWRKNEQKINGHLLWLPGIPSGDLQSKEMRAVIRGQVEQVCELIQSYW